MAKLVAMGAFMSSDTNLMSSPRVSPS